MMEFRHDTEHEQQQPFHLAMIDVIWHRQEQTWFS